MNSEGIARVERLVTWIKKHRKDLLALDGDISPTQLAAATGKKVTYWSDVLRLSKESFGASSARLTEDALDMPRLHFDGGISEPSPRRGVALDVSQHSGIIFPTTTVAWEDVLADLPKEFLLRIEDDAMAPDVRAGQTVWFITGVDARPDDYVLLKDGEGNAYLLEYKETRKGHWTAVARRSGYLPMDSKADALQVLAVFNGVVGRRG